MIASLHCPYYQAQASTIEGRASSGLATGTEQQFAVDAQCSRMLQAVGYLFRLASEEVKHRLEGLVFQELQVVPAALLQPPHKTGIPAPHVITLRAGTVVGFSLDCYTMC